MAGAGLETYAGFLVGGAGACPLVGGSGSWPSGGQVVSSGVSRGGCGLRKSLESLSADEWDCIPALFVIWPEFQHWSLQAVGWGQVSVPRDSKCLPPARGHVGPFYVCHQLLWPQREPQPLPLPQETLQDQQVGLGRALMKSLLLPWVSVHTRPCVHPPSVESLFVPVLWSFCIQALLASKANCSQGSSSWCQTPRLGSLAWGSELSVLLENFCDTIILWFVGHPPGWDGIWLYCVCAPLTVLGFLPYILGCSISFLGRSQFILLMVVQ